MEVVVVVIVVVGGGVGGPDPTQPDCPFVRKSWTSPKPPRWMGRGASRLIPDHSHTLHPSLLACVTHIKVYYSVLSIKIREG